MIFFVILISAIWGVRSCPPNHFTCEDWMCIRNEWVCDNDKDCANGEDERNCYEGTLDTEYFHPIYTTDTTYPYFIEESTSLETTTPEELTSMQETSETITMGAAIWELEGTEMSQTSTETEQLTTNENRLRSTPEIPPDSYDAARRFCGGSSCHNRGICFIENSEPQCRCQAEFQGKHCEIVIATHYNLYWIIALNMGVLIIVLVILVFGCRANKNVRRIIVHFEKSPTTTTCEGNLYEIPQKSLIDV